MFHVKNFLPVPHLWNRWCQSRSRIPEFFLFLGFPETRSKADFHKDEVHMYKNSGQIRLGPHAVLPAKLKIYLKNHDNSVCCVLL